MKKGRSFTIDTKLFKPLKDKAKAERRSESSVVENALAKELGVKL